MELRKLAEPEVLRFRGSPWRYILKWQGVHVFDGLPTSVQAELSGPKKAEPTDPNLRLHQLSFSDHPKHRFESPWQQFEAWGDHLSRRLNYRPVTRYHEEDGWRNPGLPELHWREGNCDIWLGMGSRMTEYCFLTLVLRPGTF